MTFFFNEQLFLLDIRTHGFDAVGHTNEPQEDKQRIEKHTCMHKQGTKA